MWDIPFTAGIICGFFLMRDYLKRKHDHKIPIWNKDRGFEIRECKDQIAALQKDFVEYKSRVDVLTLKAGFKL